MSKAINSPMAIFALRIGTLALRFALTIYITSSIGLVELGLFGLIVGAVMVTPSLLGLGLNFKLVRDMVSDDMADSMGVLRHRLLARVVMLSIGTLVAVPVWLALGNDIGALFVLALIVAWGEALGMDLYLALTALNANFAANLSVALRSALWVPLAVAMGLLDPAYRVLEVVMAGWAAGSIVNLAAVLYWFSRRGLFARAETIVSKDWTRKALPQSMAIWPSDLALVAITFGDRFILAALVSEAALGLYVFFWTFANAVQTLVQTSVLTPSLPRLVRMHREDLDQWRNKVTGLAFPVAGSAIALSVAAFFGIWFGHVFLPQLDFPWAPALAGIIFIGTILRLVADMFSMALNSAGRVASFAALNIGYAVATLAACWAGAMAGGLTGAMIAMAGVSLLFLVLRALAVSAEGRQDRAAPPPR
ncbi:lipopolysaccharide biosynthesis protein [Qipengyuania sphaerica]|uniref:lipopolysaccharide biosynthesis protein n=1 Tax=Qipengyuania sphaerica TaxID=2867243 RepID=UPI001C868E9E|nr:hypothetical protein [Qipengyuania sphaerica]MBX7540899.1 hypothetical protein [Qipengyuania sphaerica]